MSKHTPAPWKVGQASWTDRGFAQYELEGVTTLCVDDARLIESAPYLLAALQEYVDHFGDPLKCARAAIAKATGEKS